MKSELSFGKRKWWFAASPSLPDSSEPKQMSVGFVILIVPFQNRVSVLLYLPIKLFGGTGQFPPSSVSRRHSESSRCLSRGLSDLKSSSLCSEQDALPSFFALSRNCGSLQLETGRNVRALLLL